MDIDIEKLKRLADDCAEYKPYVTASGGVVILNGPFPAKQASSIEGFITGANPQTVLALLQRIAELEADKRRLDALEEAMKAGKHLNYHKKYFSLRGFTSYEYDVFKTVREAIDAATPHKEGNQNHG